MSAGSSVDRVESLRETWSDSKDNLTALPQSSELESINDNHHMLSWRSDPSTSFSDWAIEAVIVENGKASSSKLYHCHSNVLAWGPRRGEGFVHLFQEKMKHTPQKKISRIQVEEAEAVVFPELLDFVYCLKSLPLSVDKACVLYTMASRFGIPQLMTAIESFVEKNLDFKQSLEFISFARRHENKDKLDKLILLSNSKLCGYLMKHPEEAGQVSPSVLSHILHERSQVVKVLKGENPGKFSGEWELQKSRIISKVVARSCQEAFLSASPSTSLTRKVFRRLIDPKTLPSLDRNAALQLLQVDVALAKQEEINTATTKQNKGLNSLEERCVQALALGWREAMKREGFTLTEVLQEVAPHVLAALLVIVSKEYEKKITETRISTKQERAILDNLHSNEFQAYARETLCPNAQLQSSFSHRYDTWCTEIADMVPTTVLDQYREDGDSFSNASIT